MYRGPGFVDHHAHVFRERSGAPLCRADAVRAWHEELHEAGLNPADVEPAEGASGPGVVAAILDTHRLCAELGIVEIWEAGLVSPALVDAHLRLREHMDRFAVRVRFLVSSVNAERSHPVRTGDPWVDVVGVKFYLDGWLGARTCAACRSFLDEPTSAGILFQSSEQLAPRLERVLADGLKVVIHAIGGRAITAALDALQAVTGGERVTPAPRIEHVQDLHHEHIERMAQAGVEACIQPSFASSDVLQLRAALGEDHEEAYRWSRLIEAGVRVVTGSDYPIEDLDPLVGLRDLARGPIDPLGVDTAYRLMTDDRAGWTLLSADPTTMPVCDLGQLRCLGTEAQPRE